MKQFNAAQVQQRFNRVAAVYGAHDGLMQDIGERLLSRLSFLKSSPSRILDLGCGTGVMTKLLKKLYPDADIIGVDQSSNMLKLYQGASFLAAAHQLPFEDHSFDLVVSNIMLPWCDDLLPVFQEVKRVLKVDAPFMFSSFGPDTFCEWREVFAKIDESQHVHVFLDMHDVGDRLLKAGFGDPVMDIEQVRLKYKTKDAMLKEIKNLGLSHCVANREKGLMGKSKWRRFITSLVPTLSLELIFAYGIAADLSESCKDTHFVPLQALRDSLSRLK